MLSAPRATAIAPGHHSQARGRSRLSDVAVPLGSTARGGTDELLLLVVVGSTIVVAGGGTGSIGARSAPASTVVGGPGAVGTTRRRGPPTVGARPSRRAGVTADGGGEVPGDPAVGGGAVGGGVTGVVGCGTVGCGVVVGGVVVGGVVVGGVVVGGTVVGSDGGGVTCATAGLEPGSVSIVAPRNAASTNAPQTGRTHRDRESTTGSSPTWCLPRGAPRRDRSWDGMSRSPRVGLGPRLKRVDSREDLLGFLPARGRCRRGDAPLVTAATPANNLERT